MEEQGTSTNTGIAVPAGNGSGNSGSGNGIKLKHEGLMAFPVEEESSGLIPVNMNNLNMLNMAAAAIPQQRYEAINRKPSATMAPPATGTTSTTAPTNTPVNPMSGSGPYPYGLMNATMAPPAHGNLPPYYYDENRSGANLSGLDMLVKSTEENSYPLNQYMNPMGVSNIPNRQYDPSLYMGNPMMAMGYKGYMLPQFNSASHYAGYNTQQYSQAMYSGPMPTSPVALPSGVPASVPSPVPTSVTSTTPTNISVPRSPQVIYRNLFHTVNCTLTNGFNSWENCRIYIDPNVGYSGNAKRFKKKPEKGEKALLFECAVYSGSTDVPVQQCRACEEYFQTQKYFKANPECIGRIALIKNNSSVVVEQSQFKVLIKMMCCCVHHSVDTFSFKMDLKCAETGDLVYTTKISLNVKQWRKSNQKKDDCVATFLPAPLQANK